MNSPQVETGQMNSREDINRESNNRSETRFMGQKNSISDNHTANPAQNDHIVQGRSIESFNMEDIDKIVDDLENYKTQTEKVVDVYSTTNDPKSPNR